MTEDLIKTRRHYRALYWNWPVSLMIAHIITIDARVSQMHPDELLDARKLIDEKIQVWK